MSANRRVETLFDLSKHGLNVAVRCTRNGRRRVFIPQELMRRWARKGWSMRIARLGDHLRCVRCRPPVEVRTTGEPPTAG